MNKKGNGNAAIIIGIVAFIAFLIFIGVILLTFGIVGFTIFKVKEDLNGRIVEISDDSIFDDSSSLYNDKLFTDYDEYKKYFKQNTLTKEDFDKNNYYIFVIDTDPCSEQNFELNSYEQNGSDIKLGFTYESTCGGCAPETLIYAFKVDKSLTKVNVTVEYKPRSSEDCPEGVAYKPMIYIYPEEDMEVEVKVGNKDNLGTTYPKYNKGWKVFAKKDGTLLSNDREYYGLFWEGKNYKAKQTNEGFVVKGEDITEFLEEKLEILGLNEREINEFIVYWLPKLQSNKYNYIRFATTEEIEDYMPLYINPEPDKVIRVFMEYKALDNYIRVKEQTLDSVSREGYSIVEWGGSEIID